MYIFHLDNKKIIKLDNEHILCKWSNLIQRNKESDVYLKNSSSDDFKMLIRIMELIMSSKSEEEFARKIKILSQLSNPSTLKKSLMLMHHLEISPPEKFKIIAKIPKEASLANVIAPIVSKVYNTQKAFADEKGFKNANSLSVNDNLTLMLYNQMR